MARKNEKKYININEVNIEIDYDKLAEAIVTAQEKQTVQYSITREWMKTLLIPVFWGIAILTGLFGIAFMWQGGKTFLEAVQKGLGGCFLDTCVGGAGFVIGLFFIAVAMLTGASAKEVDKEKDKNFVVAVFSGIVSLVALVVSLIALIQGVN